MKIYLIVFLGIRPMEILNVRVAYGVEDFCVGWFGPGFDDERRGYEIDLLALKVRHVECVVTPPKIKEVSPREEKR